MQELFLEFRYKLITPGLNRVNSEFNIKKTNEINTKEKKYKKKETREKKEKTEVQQK